MKKSLLIIALAIVSLSIFNACEKNELQLEGLVMQNSLLEEGNYLAVDSEDWNMFVNNYSSGETPPHLKSASSFESMWDVLMQLDALAADSTKIEEYERLADKHAKILEGNSESGYNLITRSTLIAKSFSSDGLLKIGEKIFEITPNNFIEYTKIPEGNYDKVVLERKAKFVKVDPNASLKSASTIIGTQISHRFSSVRRVDAYLFEESIPNVSWAATYGVYSKYYARKNSRRSWREDATKNGITYYVSIGGQPMFAEDMNYYDFNYPERSVYTAEVVGSVTLSKNLRTIKYYRHPLSDGSTLPSVVWNDNDFGVQ